MQNYIMCIIQIDGLVLAWIRMICCNTNGVYLDLG